MTYAPITCTNGMAACTVINILLSLTAICDLCNSSFIDILKQQIESGAINTSDASGHCTKQLVLAIENSKQNIPFSIDNFWLELNNQDDRELLLQQYDDFSSFESFDNVEKQHTLNEAYYVVHDILFANNNQSLQEYEKLYGDISIRVACEQCEQEWNTMIKLPTFLTFHPIGNYKRVSANAVFHGSIKNFVYEQRNNIVNNFNDFCFHKECKCFIQIHKLPQCSMIDVRWFECSFEKNNDNGTITYETKHRNRKIDIVNDIFQNPTDPTSNSLSCVAIVWYFFNFHLFALIFNKHIYIVFV